MNKQRILKKIDALEERIAKYHVVSPALEAEYGNRIWKRTLSPMDELISCILSQNTSDTNRDRGFAALKDKYPTWREVQTAPIQELADTIRSAGLANQKAPRIQNVLTRIYAERGEYNIDFLADLSVDDAKAWLTQMNGIGPKTAAIVLCFGLNKPAFPVDTHVFRVSKRIGLLPEKINVEDAHIVMETVIPPQKFYAFHIQLITHGRAICKARNPLCEQCPINQYCDYYNTLQT